MPLPLRIHDPHDPHRRRRHAFQIVVYTVCFSVLGVLAAGVIYTMTDDSSPTSQTLAVAPPPRPAARASTVSPEATTAVVSPVDPQCWATRKAAERDDCQEAVATRTKFVPRYRTNQKSLASKHPVVKVANTGRGANSLARHGLLTCWLIASPRYSLDDTRAAFYLWFHQHPFTVPNDDTDAAADNVISIAVQEICPTEAAALERKGGPKADLVVP